MNKHLDEKLLRFPHKAIRAKVIRDFIADKGYDGVVCFSCGNASRELKKAGLNVLDISPQGDFIPNRWFHPSEVSQAFTGRYDATSGHLSMEVMLKIAEAYKAHFGERLPSNYIPTGSGETFVCLKLAYPHENLYAVYNIDAATRYEEKAVLNDLVKALAAGIIFCDEEKD